MDFSLTSEQESIRDSVARACAGFDDAYWLRHDTDGRFPTRFFDALAADGWLGICIPEAYGGSGLGITEAALMTGALAQSGAGMSAAWRYDQGLACGTAANAAKYLAGEGFAACQEGAGTSPPSPLWGAGWSEGHAPRPISGVPAPARD